MTREDAIKILRANVMVACDTSDKVGYDTPLNKAIEQALEMAIKALKQDPSEDCVSRKEVLEMIEQIQDAGGFIGYNTYSEAFDIVDNLPPVTPVACIAKVQFSKEDMQELVDKKVKELAQHMERKWIPCSEKLPEENGGYLVTVKRGYVTTALWVGHAEYWDKVTAWMPLPKPYKVESEE